MERIECFGEFEIAPKKTYLSLRRREQFATIGPATGTRVEVGLNAKGLTAAARLIEQPPGGMCNCRIKLAAAEEVDDAVVEWIRRAFESAR